MGAAVGSLRGERSPQGARSGQRKGGAEGISIERGRLTTEDRWPLGATPRRLTLQLWFGGEVCSTVSQGSCIPQVASSYVTTEPAHELRLNYL